MGILGEKLQGLEENPLRLPPRKREEEEQKEKEKNAPALSQTNRQNQFVGDGGKRFLSQDNKCRNFENLAFISSSSNPEVFSEAIFCEGVLNDNFTANLGFLWEIKSGLKA
jgi:hypothetical protein